MVAKTYQGWTAIGEPFGTPGHQYIQIRNPMNGKVKTCRWYTEKEYNKLYPVVKSQTDDPYYRPQKDVLGFSQGYITILQGEIDNFSDFLTETHARPHRVWGWYYPSDGEIPAEFPEGLTPIKLEWKKVGGEDGKLNPEKQVREVVESMLYESSPSEYYGELGERIEIDVVVINAIPIEGYYGTSTMHIMEDCLGNQFVWNTSSKTWAIGERKSLRATVKEYKLWHNIKQTVVKNCRER